LDKRSVLEGFAEDQVEHTVRYGIKCWMRIRVILLHLKLSDTQVAEAEVSALLIPNIRCSVSRWQV